MKKRILTGDRPSGKLHLGHYAGSLQNRVKMQSEYDQYVMIADVQALTDNFENPKKITSSIFEIAKDYLSVGINPNQTTILLQSQIPEIAELTIYYLNLVTIGRLERNPTVKAERQQKNFDNCIPLGFFCYPVSQAADITIFQAEIVPAGEDQIPIIEQTNEIVRKFNRIYKTNFLKECKPVLSNCPRLIGIDGKSKASKSLGNAIFLSDTEKEVKEKIFRMYTDPNHLRVSDPGCVTGNVVFTYLDAFHPNKEEVYALKEHYKRGGLGDITIKNTLNKTLQELLGPIRDNRLRLHTEDVEEILYHGSSKARQLAKNTIEMVRTSIGLKYFNYARKRPFKNLTTINFFYFSKRSKNMNTFEFSHREPIGSSTYPMPGDPVNFPIFSNSLKKHSNPFPSSTLYVHIPFCDQICSFCGFNKSVSPEELKALYVDTLVKEIEMYAHYDYVQKLKIGAVYLGGGTPNCLNPEQLDRILSTIINLMPLNLDCEITCEGVIQNFDSERIAALKQNKVNRVSAGIQTFDRTIREEHLHMRNGKEELLDGIANLQTHFNNFNLDFIYNLPQQTDEIWADDLNHALTSGAKHLTIYPLVLLEKTAFYSDYVKKKKHPAPDEIREIQLFQYTLEKIKSSVYTNQYSVRDWSQPGYDCHYIRMNAESNHILALGAGAHGYLAGITYRNIKSTTKYIQHINEEKTLPLEGMRISTEQERMQRYLVMGLRLKNLDIRPFKQRFGQELLTVFNDKIDSMINSGYLRIEGTQIYFTDKGDIWANNVRTFFEGCKGKSVGYMDTQSIGEDGKTHYSKISRIKASGDVEAHS